MCITNVQNNFIEGRRVKSVDPTNFGSGAWDTEGKSNFTKEM